MTEENHAMLYDLIAQNTETLERMRQSVDEFMLETRANEVANMQCRNDMRGSVPNSDFDGHRRYHEAIILRMEARAKIWTDISSSVAKWGIIGLLGLVGWAIWHEFILTIFKSAGKV